MLQIQKAWGWGDAGEEKVDYGGEVGIIAHSRVWGVSAYTRVSPGRCRFKLPASDIFKTYLWDGQPYGREVLVTP